MFCAIQLRKKEFLLFIQKSTPENISRHIQDYKFDISQLQFLLFLVYIVQQPMQTSIRLKLVDFKIIFPYVHFLSVISLLSYRITPLKLVIINLSDDITLLQYQYEKIQSIYDEFQYKIPKHITKRCLTVESTGRIYCQRNIDDSIPKLLDFFCELIYSLPHMYVYELRRDILRKSGIKSQLICKFIQENLVHGRQFPVDLVNLINVWEEKDVEEGDQLTCKLEFKFRDDYKQTDRLSYVHILKYCIDKNCALMYNELYYTKIIKQADELMDLYKRPQTKKIMDRREKLENVLNEQKLNDSLRWIIIKSQFLQVVQNEFDQFCKTQIK
ncbi:hypothetical protein SS50377_21274 [Spironucleus salmonicida]|nr:hypothetical protein SS50377_21274 [Spironucleus salmonicida]